MNNASISHENHAWYGNLWAAFGVEGVIALAFWVGSFFAEQVRDADRSFPLLEVSGGSGSGRFSLIQFLSKLLGRDYEGNDPTKCTRAGMARVIKQSGKQPVVLIESYRKNLDGFDWDELKSLYNGRIGLSLGHVSAGNETCETPFRGSLVISKDTSIYASAALMQRFIHIQMRGITPTSAGLNAAVALETLPMEQVSGFVSEALQCETTIVPMLAEMTAKYQTMLKEKISLTNGRICKNHAQMMAMVEALVHVVPITDQQKNTALTALIEMAEERHQTINDDLNNSLGLAVSG